MVYNTNGGSSIAAESKSEKWTKSYEDLPVPTRKSYQFDGWFYDQALTKAVTGDVAVNQKTVTLYAKWSSTVMDPNTTGVANWLNAVDHIDYLHGYTDGTFAPNRNMTRAEVAQMFYNLLLNKEITSDVQYTDVKDGD
ncbi:MAG: InlB B-repeat-containing protein [Dysosmobacter sp.]